MTSKIVRIFTNYEVVNESQLLGRHPNELRSQGIEVIFNRSGKADLVLVLNTVTKPRWVSVPKGNLIKLLQEPVIHRPLTHLFTYYHSHIFDQVLTHSPNPKDQRQFRSHPYLGSMVDPTQIYFQPFDHKKYMISIISSTLAILPGHQIRNYFIQNLLTRFPELKSHTFGRGRNQELVSKIHGLEKYRYSIAIENSCIPSYITEKFFDCIIAGCIPLYFGAPDIADYFPKGSYILFPINNIEECDEIIRGLSEADFESRIPALREARALIRDNYSLASLLLKYVHANNQHLTSKRRFVFLQRFDGLILMLQNLIGSIIHKCFSLR
jgi:hypothetical protein